MKKMNFLRNADIFGIPFSQRIDLNQTIYKSVYGGLITLVILAISIAYSAWILYQYQTNQLSPKITNSQYISDFKLLDLNYEVIKLLFWKNKINTIDPFEQKILLPLVIYTDNYSFAEPEIIRFSKETINDGRFYYAPKMKLEFQNISGVLQTTSQMYILIVKCTEIFLQEGEKCASQELIDRFYSQPFNTVILQLHYKQLNSKDGSLEQSVQEFYLQIEPQICQTLNAFLQSNLYEVENSLLFGQPNYDEYISGALIQSQFNSANYCSKAFQAEVLSFIYVIMQGSQTKTVFEYPKAGDLLANIGSIISVLFMMKYVIIFLDGQFLQEKVITDLINIYYPENKQVNIKRNWRRQVIEVKFNNLIIEVNDYIQFYKKVKKQIEIKLSYQNLLYEISRLYILIRSEKSRDEIRRSHQIGLRLNCLRSDLALSSQNSSQPELSSLILTDEDITLISLSGKTKQSDLQQKLDESKKLQNEFFDINKII